MRWNCTERPRTSSSQVPPAGTPGSSSVQCPQGKPIPMGALVRARCWAPLLCLSTQTTELCPRPLFTCFAEAAKAMGFQCCQSKAVRHRSEGREELQTCTALVLKGGRERGQNRCLNKECIKVMFRLENHFKGQQINCALDDITPCFAMAALNILPFDSLQKRMHNIH